MKERGQSPGVDYRPESLKKAKVQFSSSLRKKSGSRERTRDTLGGMGTVNQLSSPPVEVQNIGEEYKKRRLRMEERVQEEVRKNTHGPNKVRVTDYVPARRNDPMDELDLVPERSAREATTVPAESYDYRRSSDAVMNRIQGQFEVGAITANLDNADLVKKLNGLLKELDEMNQSKRDMQNQLISRIKFVRDLQAQVGTADNGHVTEVIDKDLEAEFRKEKQKNIKYKEQIRQVEMDIVQIREQAEEIGANLQDLEKEGITYSNVKRTKAAIAGNLEHAVQDLHHVRRDSETAVQHIRILEADIAAKSQERVRLGQEIQRLQARFDHSSMQIGRDCGDLRLELERNRALLGMKVIARAIRPALDLRRKFVFQYMRKRLMDDDSKIGCILALRKLGLRYRERRFRRYFDIWIYRGCRPMAMVKVQRGLTDFQRGNEQDRLILRQWSLAAVKQGHDIADAVNLTKALANVMNKSSMRKRKAGFDLWRGKSGHVTKARTQLATFCRDRVLFRVKQAFLRWQNTVIFGDFMIRAQAMSVRATRLTYTSQVFHGWRQAVLQIKTENMSLKIRTMKILKKHKASARKLKHGITLCLTTEETHKQFTKAQVFNALKRLAKEERHADNKDFVDGELTPSIDGLSTDCSVWLQHNHDTDQYSALQCMAKMMRKQEYLAFRQWKLYARSFKVAVLEKIKVRILKTYRDRQSVAFTQWQNSCRTKKKRKKMMMHTDIQQNMMETETEARKLKQQTDDEMVRSKNRGKKIMNKVVKKHLLNYFIRGRFNAWKLILEDEDEKKALVDRVLLKMDRRFLKRGFEHYKEMTRGARIWKAQDDKGVQYEQIIRFKAMKRLYTAWHNYQQAFHIAKVNLRKALKSADRRSKKKWYEVWLKESKEEVKNTRRKRQSMMIQGIQGNQETLGDLMTDLHTKEQQLATRAEKQASLQQRTATKVIAAWRNHQLHSALMTWRGKALHQRSVNAELRAKYLIRWKNRGMQAAFATWRVALKEDARKKKKHFISQIVHDQNGEEGKIVNVAKERRKNHKVQSHNIKSTKDEVSKLKTKLRNRANNKAREHMFRFCISKQARTFTAWKHLVQDRRESCRRLAVLAKRSARQTAVDAIRDFAWGTFTDNRKRKFITRLLKAHSRGWMIVAFGEWKQRSYNLVKSRDKTTREALYHRVQNDGFARWATQEGIAQNMLNCRNLRIMKITWRRFKDYTWRKTMEKQLIREGREKILLIRSKLAMQKWKLRTLKTIEGRQNCNFGRNTKHAKLYQRKCFDAWKRQFYLKSRIVKQLKVLCDQSAEYQREFAFRQIKATFKSRKQARLDGVTNGFEGVADVVRTWNKKKMQRYFDRYKRNILTNDQRALKFRGVFLRRATITLRKAFFRWAHAHHEEEAVDEANDHGRARLALIQAEKDRRNLREMLEDDGYTEKEIRQLHLDDDAKYAEQVEVMLSRNICYGDGRVKRTSMYLLPWCLDKWRKYVKERKLMRYWILWVERRYRKRSCSLKLAFDTWSAEIFLRKEQLARVPLRALKDAWRINQKTIGEATKRISENQFSINHMKAQRAFLIDKVFAGQKLGLDMIHQNYIRALRMAFKRWSERTNNIGIKRSILGGTKANMELLDFLKRRTEELEKENGMIVQQNDELKAAAQGSVELVRQSEDMQKQIETQSTELAQKATQIRELLQKNVALNRQLRNAQQRREKQ